MASTEEMYNALSLSVEGKELLRSNQAVLHMYHQQLEHLADPMVAGQLCPCLDCVFLSREIEDFLDGS